MRKFKTESKRILDLMINSIYTHKEIFLREILSNASDAIDKLYYKSLMENLSFTKDDFQIKIDIDKEKGILKVTDNGIGMTEKELEDNLGVIAKSGSYDFVKNLKEKKDIEIIGQFGVGFYSAFMVSDKVEVLTKAYGSGQAFLWTSKGAEGYEIKSAEKEQHGTDVIMYIKKSVEEENYEEFLSEYRIRELVKKYSDYIKYPIKMDVEKTKKDPEDEKKSIKYKEEETLNTMIPLWKRNKSEIKEEEYNNFYKETFFDFENPLKVIHTSVEGMSVDYNAILFIPSKAPFNYYTKNYEKGIRLYTKGILIMEKCAELLPDYFSFVKGMVDSELTLNISRETIQHNSQLKRIAKSIQKKIKSELLDMMQSDREKYEKFFNEFGLQLKYGMYENWGMNKDEVKDLILFYSLNEEKMISFKEYVEKMKDSQKYIYYAQGKSVDAIKLLPQVEKVREYGYDILCMTEEIDEFAIKVLNEYDKKEFRSVSSGDLGLDEKEKDIESKKDKEILKFIKDSLEDKVVKVRLSASLRTHPVCLASEGDVSIEMEKVFKAMPNSKGITAQKILEINPNHKIYEKIKKLYEEDKEELKDISQILLTQAMLIEGLPIENPAEYSDMVCKRL
ncbi:MAG: molecular chaperone HtpG [Bacillota bacterium]|jgi:molecular chaperone HtpG|nr:molecular chaperone HtpG [Bacillota bacterium]HHU43816.1 molecular chaperone HtpG [Clostridiales bacterium]